MYTYDIVTEDGDIVMTIKSEFDTRLSFDDYAGKIHSTHTTRA